MTLNFPTSPTDGQRYPYTDPITNTVTVYTWNNTYKLWTAQTQGQEILPDLSGDPHQPSTLDERYIEKSGDNMDGTLTVNTNKIELKYDGSATFAKSVEAGSNSPGNFSGVFYSNGDDTGLYASVYAQNMTAGGRVFAGVSETGGQTTSIFNDGSATFSGTLDWHDWSNFSPRTTYNAEPPPSRPGRPGKMPARPDRRPR